MSMRGRLATAVGATTMVWALALPVRAGVLQADRVDVASVVPGQTSFQSVSFARPFDRTPLVFVLPTEDGADPASLRIRNVTATGFEIAPVEPAGEDAAHPGMTAVAYVAVEPGRTELAPGVVLDAGVVRTSTVVQARPPFADEGGYDTVEMRHTFASAPAVIATVQTTRNETAALPGAPSVPWMTVSVINVQTDRFDLALERAEADDGGTVDAEERVAYLAVQTTSGTFDAADGQPVTWEALVSATSIRGFQEAHVAVPLNAAFADAPIVVAGTHSRAGNNGGWVRRGTVAADSVELFVDEDRVRDSERSHTTETPVLAAFSRPFDAALPTANLTLTWTGAAASRHWSERTPVSNWDRWDGDDQNLVPGDRLLFDSTGAASPVATVDVAYTAALAGLRFEDASAYTLDADSASLRFADGAAIANASTAVQTLAVPIAARGDTLTIDAGAGAGGGFAFTSAATIDLRDTGGVALIVTGANPTALAGAISGTGGSLVKTGAGTLTLSAANSYTGGTTLAAGTLALEHNDALAAGPVTVTGPARLTRGPGFDALAADFALAADLTVDADAALAMTGRIIGAGRLVKEGAGTVTLTGDNAFAGATVSAGALVADTDSLTGNLAADAAAVFDQEADGTFASQISGGGTVEKRGAGTLTLSAASPFTGTLTVAEGTLALPGSVAGPVVNRARFLGTGSVGSLRNEAGGTVAPGASIGVMTVLGDYIQETASTLEIEIDAALPRGPGSSHDRLDVDGAATLAAGSTVRLLVTNPNELTLGEAFTVIDAAGGVADAGTTVLATGLAGSFFFARDPAFTDGDAAWRVVTQLGSLADQADDDEARGLAKSLDQLAAGGGGAAGEVLTALGGLDSSSLNRALDDLSPRPLDLMPQITTDAAAAYHGHLASHLSAARRGEPGLVASRAPQGPDAGARGGSGGFAQAVGFRIDQQTFDRAGGFTAEAYGGQMGIDGPAGVDGSRLGFGLATIHSDVSLARGRGSMREDVLRVGPYATCRPGGGPWYVDGSLTYGFHHVRSDRRVPTLGLAAEATFDAHDLSAYAGAGCDLPVGPLTVTPEASLQYLYLSREPFREDGPVGLAMDRQESRLLEGTLGLAVRGHIQGKHVTCEPSVHAGWRHRLMRDVEDLGARFVAGGGPFRVDAAGPDRDELLLGAALKVRLSHRVAAYVRYDATTSSHRTTHAAIVGVRVDF